MPYFQSTEGQAWYHFQNFDKIQWNPKKFHNLNFEVSPQFDGLEKVSVSRFSTSIFLPFEMPYTMPEVNTKKFNLTSWILTPHQTSSCSNLSQ